MKSKVAATGIEKNEKPLKQTVFLKNGSVNPHVKSVNRPFKVQKQGRPFKNRISRISAVSMTYLVCLREIILYSIFIQFVFLLIFFYLFIFLSYPPSPLFLCLCLCLSLSVSLFVSLPVCLSALSLSVSVSLFIFSFLSFFVADLFQYVFQISVPRFSRTAFYRNYGAKKS